MFSSKSLYSLYFYDLEYTVLKIINRNNQWRTDGVIEICGGHDVRRVCITCIYIKYKYSNYYLHSKIIHRSFFFANQSINSCSHVG